MDVILRGLFIKGHIVWQPLTVRLCEAFYGGLVNGYEEIKANSHWIMALIFLTLTHSPTPNLSDAF